MIPNAKFYYRRCLKSNFFTPSTLWRDEKEKGITGNRLIMEYSSRQNLTPAFPIGTFSRISHFFFGFNPLPPFLRKKNLFFEVFDKKTFFFFFYSGLPFGSLKKQAFILSWPRIMALIFFLFCPFEERGRG